MNPENQPTASEIIQNQLEHTNNLRNKAAGDELLARFASLSKPAVETQADRTQQNTLETEITRCQTELDSVLTSVADLSEHMIRQDTGDYIKTMRAHINDLRSRLEVESPESHEPVSTESLTYLPTPEYEDGQSRLNELYQKERSICTEWGGQLAFLECSTRMKDAPRRSLRQNLVTNIILPSFILDAEQSALEISPNADPIPPIAAVQLMETTLESIKSRFTYLFTSQGRNLPIRSIQLTTKIGQDVFDLILVCNNNANGQQIHNHGKTNDVLFYRQEYITTGSGYLAQQVLQTDQYPWRYSLDQFFERYPNVARDLALIQAAEQQAGESEGLFAKSLDPHYLINDEDGQQIENLVRSFTEMNDQRVIELTIEQEKLDSLTRAIAEVEQLRTDPQRAQCESDLNTLSNKLSQADQRVIDIQHRLRRMEQKLPGIFDFAGRQRVAATRLELQKAETAQDNLQQNVANQERIMANYRGRHERLAAELTDFGLYFGSSSMEMDRRLNHQRARVADLHRHLAREHQG